MIIGIAGPINAGKDTFGNLLCGALSNRAAITVDSFAAPIRQIAQHLGFRLEREFKEQTVWRIFSCFEEELHKAIEEHLGGLPDNTKAELFARTVEVLRNGHYLRSGMFDDTLEISSRKFMQLFGTEVGRTCNSSLWIEALHQRTACYDHVIITDVRFIEEANYCDYLIYIVRDNVSLEESHESEQQHIKLILKSDMRVYNNGDYSALATAAELVAKELVKGTVRG